MDEYLGADTKQGLLQIDSFEGFERKRFLRTLLNTATNDLSFSDITEPLTADLNILQNAVLTIFTIATKHNIPGDDLRTFLTRLPIQDASISDLLENYDHSKEEIRMKLAKYGHDIPWATNVNWKLSSVLRSSGKEELNAELVYKVTFEGAGPTGRSIVANFDCTLEELQHLSSKFKEIERNCQRIAGDK